MSRWSTPKSYGNRRGDAYINLDNEPYQMNAKEFVRAPRKVKRRDVYYIHQRKVPSAISFPSSGDQTPLTSQADSQFDLDEQRGGGKVCSNLFPNANNDDERVDHIVDRAMTPSWSTPLIDVEESRDQEPSTHGTTEGSCITRCPLPVTDQGVTASSRAKSQFFDVEEEEKESRDQVEQARFGIIGESRTREERFPFDELRQNDCTYEEVTSHITIKDTPPPSFRQSGDPFLFPPRSSSSQARMKQTTTPNCANPDLNFQYEDSSVVDSPFDLRSPPRVSRFPSPSPQYNFDLSLQRDRIDRITYPTQTREYKKKKNIITRPKKIPLSFLYHKIVGSPSMQIHRLRLPERYLHLLDKIVHGCEVYANGLSDGWNTQLYSLTKQDIALREVSYLNQLSRPIVSYMTRIACILYGVNGLTCDNNQPHVLKYTEHHTGVGLHHDKCDITMNLMMSRSDNYIGGGTYFEAAKTNVRLEFGEFLLHPGQAVHGGTDIDSGSRILMVVFANCTQK